MLLSHPPRPQRLDVCSWTQALGSCDVWMNLAGLVEGGSNHGPSRDTLIRHVLLITASLQEDMANTHGPERDWAIYSQTLSSKYSCSHNSLFLQSDQRLM